MILGWLASATPLPIVPHNSFSPFRLCFPLRRVDISHYTIPAKVSGSLHPHSILLSDVCRREQQDIRFITAKLYSLLHHSWPAPQVAKLLQLLNFAYKHPPPQHTDNSFGSVSRTCRIGKASVCTQVQGKLEHMMPSGFRGFGTYMR